MRCGRYGPVLVYESSQGLGEAGIQCSLLYVSWEPVSDEAATSWRVAPAHPERLSTLLQIDRRQTLTVDRQVDVMHGDQAKSQNHKYG